MIRTSQVVAQPGRGIKKAVLRPDLGEAVAPRLEPGASYQMPWRDEQSLVSGVFN